MVFEKKFEREFFLVGHIYFFFDLQMIRYTGSSFFFFFSKSIKKRKIYAILSKKEREKKNHTSCCEVSP